MAYNVLYTYYVYYTYYICRQTAGYVNMFAFTGTFLCDLVTSGETDQMDKHHAADCQVPEIAAATSDPFGGNKVNMGRTLSQSSAKMKGCQGC